MIKIILSLFLLFNICYGQNIPSRYKKTVVFIYSASELGESKPIGTGFLLLMKDSSNFFGYLVTNKHVITNPITKRFYRSINVRYNRDDKSSVMRTVSLEQDGLNQGVYLNEDPSVDLSVIPYVIQDGDVKYCLTSELFSSKKAFDTSYISEGTNLFYTGMFSPYLGYKRNFPIIRFGKVSLLTDEKILFDSTEPKADLFLAETTTFGGNSGSPVFAYGSDYKINSHDSSDPVNTREQNNVPIYLVGIIKGYYGEDSPISFKKTSVMTPTYSSNIGITAIIPSYLLSEILNSEELKLLRRSINNLKTQK